jgi:DNA-binding MarR family transcriptional regulator
MASGRLRDELKKRNAFEAPEQEALLNLWRTGDCLQHRFARLFREHGLTSTQYNVLRILRGEGRPLPCLEIAGRLIAAVPGITGLIDRLEALGLVARERSDDDRRVVLVRITPEGRARVDQLDRPVLALHRTLLGHLSAAELDALNRLLEKARRACGAEAACDRGAAEV